MKYSVSLQFMWSELPFPERARRAAAHGLDRVDLWDWRDCDIDELARVCREEGLEIGGFFGHRAGSLIDPSLHELVLRELARSVEVAERVGARQLHMFSDEIGPESRIRKPPPSPWEAKWQACVEGLRRCLELVEGRPVQLVLEAINDVFVPGYFLRDASLATALCRTVDHPQLRLSFDCYHQQLSGGRLVDHLREALPHCVRVDVADVPGRGQPGTGEINFHTIRRVLEEEGYEGQVTFEVVPAGGDSERAMADIKEVFPF
ncbi:MAG TPA: TIM barrel protein [Actinomycetota bacterium]|nr:TIM barrel protein [Actinomycetota bacterium]